jgi:adenosylcobinamide-GDP ribazoletransferase
MRVFILMLQFLTRIPINIQLQAESKDFAKGVKYFPLVGLVVGSINVIGYSLVSLVFSKTVAVIFTCLLNIMITGAFHLDGLADTCDGIFSSRTRERMLEIMRDSRIGANGAIAIFFDLVLRIGFLIHLKDPALFKAVLIAPVISRTAMIYLMSAPPARAEGGLGNLFLGKVRLWDGMIAGALCLALVVLILNYQALSVIAVNLIAIWGYRRLILKQIQGMTGDTLGAGNEVSEIMVLATLGLKIFGC